MCRVNDACKVIVYKIEQVIECEVVSEWAGSMG